MFFFFQAEDGIRDLVRSRGLGDVYKRQLLLQSAPLIRAIISSSLCAPQRACLVLVFTKLGTCLLYTSDAADDLLCVDLGGRRIIKKKQHANTI